MTKNDLAGCLHEQLGLSKREALEVLETCFEVMKASLAEGHEVKVAGLGTFGLRDKAPRKGRNPKSGDIVEISARRVITFKVSDRFKRKVNGKP